MILGSIIRKIKFDMRKFSKIAFSKLFLKSGSQNLQCNCHNYGNQVFLIKPQQWRFSELSDLPKFRLLKKRFNVEYEFI